MSKDRNPIGPINTDPSFLQFLIQALRQHSMSPQPPMPLEAQMLGPMGQPPQPQSQPAAGQPPLEAVQRYQKQLRQM